MPRSHARSNINIKKLLEDHAPRVIKRKDLVDDGLLKFEIMTAPIDMDSDLEMDKKLSQYSLEEEYDEWVEQRKMQRSGSPEPEVESESTEKTQLTEAAIQEQDDKDKLVDQSMAQREGEPEANRKRMGR